MITMDDLRPIFDGFSACDRANAISYLALLVLLHQKGFLTKEDLQALKVVLERESRLLREPHDNLLSTPLCYIVDMIAKIGSSDQHPMFSVIEGDKKDNP